MKYYKEPALYPTFEFARSMTAHYSKSFYISAKLLPDERRWATYAVYGFCRYADDLIDNPRNRTAEELMEEVSALEQELDRSYRSGESEHPVLKPFMAVAKQYGIPKKYPLELLKGVQMDVHTNRYETFDDLYLFCYRVAGVVGLMMTHVLGFKHDSAFDYAEKMGIAMQLTNILRDVREDKIMNRIYLPVNEMRQFGVVEDMIMNERMNNNVHNLIKYQVNRAHRFYEEANPGIAVLARKSQFAIYAASTIYRGILRKIEARDYNPFLGRVFVPQTKKISILLDGLIRTRLKTENLQPVSIYPQSYHLAEDL